MDETDILYKMPVSYLAKMSCEINKRTGAISDVVAVLLLSSCHKIIVFMQFHGKTQELERGGGGSEFLKSSN